MGNKDAADGGPQVPKFFFDSRGGGYWLQLASTRFLPLDTGQLKLHLREAGLSADEFIGNLNELEKELLTAQVERHVDYAGPLAGHGCGFFQTSGGKRVLVTSEPRLDLGKPKRSEFPFIDGFLSALLGADQCEYFFGWLKVARESLFRRDFRPGQMLALAGPHSSGKSFFHVLVTESLGGRCAKPYRYMMEKTAFNADLAAAEHLYIEDENASTDIRSRRAFGASIKDFTVNAELSIHAKGRDAVTLPTFKRLTLSVNNEPENLSILPPMDESITDKIMLFECRDATKKLHEDRLKNLSSLRAELPAFLAALEKHRIRPKLADHRFGVRAWHSPTLLELLCDLAPETRLSNLIDEILFSKDGDSWDGSAEQLEKTLRASAFNFAVDKLLNYSSACGVYLARLQAKHPARFMSRKRAGKTIWLVKPPKTNE